MTNYSFCQPFLVVLFDYILYKKRVIVYKTTALCLKKLAITYSPTLYRSTIGASGLNFSVRDGKRWNPAAIVT